MVLVAVGVVLHEEGARFGVAVLRDEPPGGLGEEEDDAADEAGADHLEPEGEAPVEVGGGEVLVGAVDGGGGEDGALGEGLACWMTG